MWQVLSGEQWWTIGKSSLELNPSKDRSQVKTILIAVLTQNFDSLFPCYQKCFLFCSPTSHHLWETLNFCKRKLYKEIPLIKLTPVFQKNIPFPFMKGVQGISYATTLTDTNTLNSNTFKRYISIKKCIPIACYGRKTAEKFLFGFFVVH